MHIVTNPQIHAIHTCSYMHIHAHTCNNPTPPTWNGHISATNYQLETSKRADLITVSDRRIVAVCSIFHTFAKMRLQIKNWSRGHHWCTRALKISIWFQHTRVRLIQCAWEGDCCVFGAWWWVPCSSGSIYMRYMQIQGADIHIHIHTYIYLHIHACAKVTAGKYCTRTDTDKFLHIHTDTYNTYSPKNTYNCRTTYMHIHTIHAHTYMANTHTYICWPLMNSHVCCM